MIGRRRNSTSRERTPEERARAASERAARRAARQAADPPPPDVPPPAPPREVPPPAPPREVPPPAPPREVPPPAPPPPARQAPPLPPRHEPPAAPNAGAAAAPAREALQPPPAPRPQPAVPPPAPARPIGAEEAGAGPALRPVRRPARAALPRSGGRSRAVRPGAPARPPAARPDPGRGGRGRRRLLAVLALLAGAVVLWLAFQTFQPFRGTGDGAVSVEIPDGAGVGRIGDLLAERGVIDSPTFFALNATITGRRGGLRSGNYRLARGMSYGAVLDALTQGPSAKVVPTFGLTIPEGRSRREIVPLVRRTSLRGSYLKATSTRAVLRRIRRLGAPRGTRTLEGFLFPATYELVRDADVEDLVDKQLDAFAESSRAVDMRAARRRNLTRYDVIIIASMVEREAQLDRERPLIAAVIHNRLREGIPLGIDATIRYAENNWSRPLRVSELNRPGPYNTRLRRGLPPTPIGNPGLKSLQAAARPAKVSYLYYVVKPGTCGEHAFSSTEARFARDRARYEAERARMGGRSPTKC